MAAFPSIKGEVGDRFSFDRLRGALSSAGGFSCGCRTSVLAIGPIAAQRVVASSTYRSLISNPMNRRPNSLAAREDVPEPTKGSSTRSPFLVVKAMHRAGSDNGNSAPWPLPPGDGGSVQTSVSFSLDSCGRLGPPRRTSNEDHAAFSKYGVSWTARWRICSACRVTRLLTGSGVESLFQVMTLFR